MAVIPDEGGRKDEAKFSPQETSLILRAALMDASVENAELRTRAQMVLLEMAQTRGVDVNPNGTETLSALDEIDYSIAFVFELADTSEGEYYYGLFDNSAAGEQELLDVLRIYLGCRGARNPSSLFRSDMSVWFDSKVSKVCDYFTFEYYLREVDWSNYYEAETGPLSTMFLLELPDLLRLLDEEGRTALEEKAGKVLREAVLDGEGLRPIYDRGFQTLADILRDVMQRFLENVRNRGDAIAEKECFERLVTEPILNPEIRKLFSEEFEARFAR